MTQSTASNLLLQVVDYQEKILLPPTDANAEVIEIPSTASEKGDRTPKELQSPTRLVSSQHNYDIKHSR